MLAKAVGPIQSVAPLEPAPPTFRFLFKEKLGRAKDFHSMSDRGPDPSVDTSPMQVASDTKDKRKDIGDYRIAHSLLKSIIMPTDVQNFEEAGGAFRIQDSYDSLLQISIGCPPPFTHLQLIFNLS